MDIRGMRTLRASMLALAATAAGILGSSQSASAQTFNFSPTGTGTGVSTTGLVFAPSSALVLNEDGTSAIPLVNGASFTLLYQTNLTGLVDPTTSNIITAPLGGGQVTEVAILHETATVVGNTATFSLTPGATQDIKIYQNNVMTLNAAAGTGYTTGTVIANLLPNDTTPTSSFANYGATTTFNQNGAGFQAGSGTLAVTGNGGFTFNTAVMTLNPAYFNPPTGTPALTGSSITGSLQPYFTSNAPASLFTDPLTSATFVPNIGAVNGATGPNFEIAVSGFQEHFSSTAVPEPASVTLMGLGVIGALVVVRRTRARVA